MWRPPAALQPPASRPAAARLSMAAAMPPLKVRRRRERAVFNVGGGGALTKVAGLPKECVAMESVDCGPRAQLILWGIAPLTGKKVDPKTLLSPLLPPPFDFLLLAGSVYLECVGFASPRQGVASALRALASTGAGGQDERNAAGEEDGDREAAPACSAGGAAAPSDVEEAADSEDEEAATAAAIGEVEEEEGFVYLSDSVS